MIPGLPQIGATELIILLAIILLFFGARRIPELARSLGKGTREFRMGASEDADALPEHSGLPGEERSATAENAPVEQKASS